MSTELLQPNVVEPIPLAVPPRGAITWRSILLGTLMVATVCGITPYNDYVVANTMMVGIYLPVLMVILFFGLVIFINGPLHKFAPRYAFSPGELGVAMAMTLVASSIPGQGLMRGYIPLMVAPFHHALGDSLFWKNFTGMNLPGWLFPVETISTGQSSDVMHWFYNAMPQGASAPYAAWIIPLLGWGVFVGAMFVAMMALASIVTPQWAINERLAFPLAQVEQALIEAPPPGKALNDLFRNRLFWIATIGILILQSLVTLREYFPRYIPLIPLRYDLHTTFANEPWIFFTDNLKSARIYFMFLGLAYFIPSRVSFSMWGSYLATELITVQQRMVQSDISDAAWADQHLGASVAFLIGIIWIGRHHWGRVIKQATSLRPDPRWPTYRAAVYSGIAGVVVMIGWLMLVGVQWWVAMMIVAFLFLVHVVVARIVAETGLVFIRVLSSPMQIITNLPATSLRGADVFFSGAWQMNGAHATRESVFAFATHGLKINDAGLERKRSIRGLIVLMLWAGVFGYAVAAASSLYCYYHYSLPLGTTDLPMLNQWGMQNWPRDVLAEPINRWSEGHFAPKAYNSWMHMGIGLSIAGVLQAATLRWAWWPFLPVGYLVSTTWYIRLGWLSIFLGWLAKQLIVKYGGAQLYQKAKPFFFGLVFGEALAAGLWALINLGMALGGANYKVVQLLPY